MANRRGRDALRGEEVPTMDLIAEVLDAEQWSELLEGPLERAAGQGNRALAQTLLEAGAQIGDALHHAVGGGHREVVTDLLESGASIKARETPSGRTPLHVAADEGRTEIVQLLVLKGADKDGLNAHKDTPLFAAILNGHVTAALALVAGGADVSIPCGETRSVVDVAAQEGHVPVLRALIKHGADVNAADRELCTALHIAAHHNRVEAVDILVEAGADVEARDNDGFTPLVYAARSFSLEALTALLKCGAYVNTKTDHYFRTPLHYATRSPSTGKTASKVVDLLLRSGADETIPDRDGFTAAGLVAVPEDIQPNEDANCVRKLLVNAPADRAWRRRGFLVLCRAHPNRVQQVLETSIHQTGMTPGTCSVKSTDTIGCTGVKCSTVDERGDRGWALVVVHVLGLQEDGIFRAVVGFL